MWFQLLYSWLPLFISSLTSLMVSTPHIVPPHRLPPLPPTLPQVLSISAFKCLRAATVSVVLAVTAALMSVVLAVTGTVRRYPLSALTSPARPL